MPLLNSSPIIETDYFGKILLLADTHIGYEVELLMKGIRVPKQTRRMLEHYIGLIQRENVNSLAIVGDVKHEIPIALETYRDVEYFLRELASHLEYLMIVQGNHDGGIDKIVEKLNMKNILLYDTRGALIGVNGDRKILLIHGNAKPRIEDFIKADFLVMGHTHPVVMMRDIVGYTIREPVIIRVELDKYEIMCEMYRRELKQYNTELQGYSRKIVAIILPCSNMLISGTDITRTLLQKPSSSKTILTYFKLWEIPDKIEVYLQDFTYLGTLRELLELEKIVETREKVNWDLL